MIKTNQVLGMVAIVTLSMFMGSCSSDDSTESTAGSTRQLSNFTAKSTMAGTGNVAATRGYRQGAYDGTTYFIWELNDQINVFNRTYKSALAGILTATNVTEVVEGESNTVTWAGTADVLRNEEIIAVYPSMNFSPFVTSYNRQSGNLVLDLTKQTNYRGTDITRYYNLMVSDKTSALGNFTDAPQANFEFKDKNCIFEYHFCDEDGNVLTIRNLRIHHVPVSGIYNLDADTYTDIKTGDLTFTDVNADSIFVAHLPGYYTVGFTLTTTDGKTYNHLNSKPYDMVSYTTVISKVTVNIGGDTPTPDPDDPGHIDIDGVKWATGNLQYDTQSEKSEGFKNNWKIADHQWSYFNQVNGNDCNHRFYQTCGQVDHFNWGTSGKCATTFDCRTFSYIACWDITKKEYYGCRGERDLSYDLNNPCIFFGDVAYWASNGKYRTPTAREFQNLICKTSMQYGYCVENGKKIYGHYFYKSTGCRKYNPHPREITSEELKKGVFLPFAGNRKPGAQLVSWAGSLGTYWTTTPTHHCNAYAARLTYDKWGDKAAIVHRCGRKSEGYAIRPVLVK